MTLEPWHHHKLGFHWVYDVLCASNWASDSGDLRIGLQYMNFSINSLTGWFKDLEQAVGLRVYAVKLLGRCKNRRLTRNT